MAIPFKAPRVRIRFKNLKDPLARLDSMEARVLQAVESAVYTVVQEAMTLSKQKYVPRDLGVLVNSGYVETPVMHGTTVRVVGGFGGPAQAYAEIQHRIPFNHPEGGTDHYWSRALEESAGSLRSTVAEYVRRAMDGQKVVLPTRAHPDNPWEGSATNTSLIKRHAKKMR